MPFILLANKINGVFRYKKVRLSIKPIPEAKLTSEIFAYSMKQLLPDKDLYTSCEILTQKTNNEQPKKCWGDYCKTNL